jgi:hypothetical protein
MSRVPQGRHRPANDDTGICNKHWLQFWSAAKYAFTSLRLKKTTQRHAITIGMRKNKVGKIVAANSMPPEMLPAGILKNATTPTMPLAARSPLKTSVEIRAQRHARNSPIPVPKPQAANPRNQIMLRR